MKDQHIKGGSQFLYDSSFIISISKTPDDGNSKIKVIRSKFTPAKTEQDGRNRD